MINSPRTKSITPQSSNNIRNGCKFCDSAWSAVQHFDPSIEPWVGIQGWKLRCKFRGQQFSYLISALTSKWVRRVCLVCKKLFQNFGKDYKHFWRDSIWWGADAWEEPEVWEPLEQLRHKRAAAFLCHRLWNMKINKKNYMFNQWKLSSNRNTTSKALTKPLVLSSGQNLLLL